ncbi:MAG: heme exporter protein CcmB [Longimicrobiales bacterium]|nr:heme exporter protein CcmB [Longimicrobiales bacterium]
MRAYLRQLGAVVWKDVVVELRTRERIAAMAAFAVLAGVLFNYAVDPASVALRELASGLIWLTIVFGGMLGLARTFQMEEEEGALQGLLLSPIPRDALFLGKLISNFLLLMVTALLILGVFYLFFDLRLEGSFWVLVAILAEGVFGFAAVGTLFSAISVRSSMGETLLPILVFPILIPVVVFGVSATNRVFLGRPLAEVAGNIRMLGAFGLGAVLVGALLFRYVVEE